MSVSTPGPADGGSASGSSGVVRLEGDEPHPSLSHLKDLILPVESANQRHSIVVAVILVLDAALVLVLPVRVSGILSTGPAYYLLLPAAASLYMALALVSANTAHRGTGVPRGFGALAGISLTWALSLASLIALTGGPLGLLTGVIPRPWLYPGCIAGITLPIASLWSMSSIDPARRRVGLSASLLPPLLALATFLPHLDPQSVLVLTSTTLVLGAVLFLIPGSYGRRSVPPTGARLPPSDQQVRPTHHPPHPRVPVPVAPSGGTGFGTASRPVPGTPTYARAAAAPKRVVSSGRWPDVVSTGFTWLDELFLGGFPRRGQLALIGEPGQGCAEVVWGTLTEGLRRGESVVIATASASVTEIGEQLERFCPGFTDYDRQGLVHWVDASGRSRTALADPSTRIDHDGGVRALLSLMAAAQEAERQSPRGFRMAFLDFSAVLLGVGDAVGMAVFRNMVGIFEGRPVIALYTLDPWEQSVPVLQQVVTTLDGAVIFRSVGGRPFLKVVRVGPVESRSWVPCKFEEREKGPRSRTLPRGRGIGELTSPEFSPPAR